MISNRPVDKLFDTGLIIDLQRTVKRLYIITVAYVIEITATYLMTQTRIALDQRPVTSHDGPRFSLCQK